MIDRSVDYNDGVNGNVVVDALLGSLTCSRIVLAIDTET